MYASGLNAIQIYVYWNEHEPSPGVYDFDNQNNIFEFIELAQKTGFVGIEYFINSEIFHFTNIYK
jgi:beta-galactosidase GanA